MVSKILIGILAVCALVLLVGGFIIAQKAHSQNEGQVGTNNGGLQNVANENSGQQNNSGSGGAGVVSGGDAVLASISSDMTTDEIDDSPIFSQEDVIGAP